MIASSSSARSSSADILPQDIGLSSQYSLAFSRRATSRAACSSRAAARRGSADFSESIRRRHALNRIGQIDDGLPDPGRDRDVRRIRHADGVIFDAGRDNLCRSRRRRRKDARTRNLHAEAHEHIHAGHRRRRAETVKAGPERMAIWKITVNAVTLRDRNAEQFGEFHELGIGAGARDLGTDRDHRFLGLEQ